MLPTPRVNFVSGFVLDVAAGLGELFQLPLPERLEYLLDPASRRELEASAQTTDAGGLRLLTKWGRLDVVQTFAEANAGLAGRTVGEIAAERGQDAFDCLLDIVCADDLRTVVATAPIGDDDESWEQRRKVWRDPRTLIGGSDAGAHLDMIDTFGLASFMLGPMVRDRKLLSLEAAVHHITDAPADLYGVRRSRPSGRGAWADVVIFDPDDGSAPIRRDALRPARRRAAALRRRRKASNTSSSTARRSSATASSPARARATCCARVPTRAPSPPLASARPPDGPSPRRPHSRDSTSARRWLR